MHSISTNKRERGDTLVEVLVSIAILGALITLAYAVMSRGFASTQNSLDRTGTQAIISGQASMLRAAHARAANGITTGYWDKIVEKTPNKSAINSANLADGCKTSLTGGDRLHTFYFDPTATYNAADPTANGPLLPQLYYTSVPPDDSGLIAQNRPALGDGIWIEGHKELIDGVYSFTFYIKACYEPAYGDGSDILRQAKTVVRLYDPL